MSDEPNDGQAGTEAAAPATPATAEERVRAAFPGLEQIDARELAELGASLDWSKMDVECPACAVYMIGVEPVDMRVKVRCECGQGVIVNLDGDKEARCPGCHKALRYVVVMQHEDSDESAAALAIEAILGANR